MMNITRKVICLVAGCFSFIGAEAQSVDCTTSTKLVCIVPFRTGANNSGQTAAANIFSGPIGTQLSQLPLAASAPGAVILTIGGNAQAYPNLGPVLIDRPDSVGRGRLVLGFSAQQFNFKHLDGISIDAIPFIYQVPQSSEYYQQTIHTAMKYNQYVLLATYGLPKDTDISVVVPFTRISIGVAALNATQYFVNGDNTILSQGPAPGGYTHGSASGVGDVVVNIKHVLWNGGDAGRGSVAAGLALRVPSGDALNYLGSGANGYNLYALAAYKAKFSPHVKLGYQWNTNSILLNIGDPTAKKQLPGGLQTAVGADIAASRYLTISADVLSNEFQNSPYVTEGLYTGATNTPPSTPPTPISTSKSVLTGNKTFTTANLTAGLKWKPFRRKDLVLYGNILIQMNDVGLRSDPSPSGGISYNFHGPDKWPRWLYRSPDHW